jgi:hypothetical protein
MMGLPVVAFGAWLSGAAALASDSPVFDTYESELRMAAGAGGFGLWGRASHTWRKGAPALRTGVALGAYTGSEDFTDGAMAFDGRVSDIHLNLHASPIWRPGRKDRLALETGLYVGGYWYRSNGTFTHSALDITETATTNALLPDIGLRLAAGWRIRPGWTVQLSVEDSLRRVGGAQGVLGGLFTMDADAKVAVGAGLAWRPGAAKEGR